MVGKKNSRTRSTVTMLADVASGASQRGNGNSSQPAGLKISGHPKRGKQKGIDSCRKGRRPLKTQ
jgi:hypothetical protein